MSEQDLVDPAPVDTAPIPGNPGAEHPVDEAELGIALPIGPGGQGPELTPGGVITRRAAAPFEVHLDVFQGPFDLLLGLIAKHKLDITEVSLAKVTDEFVAHIKAAQSDESGDSWDLSQASEFVVVAATLLDLKAARLLPQAGPEDEEDLALIEARDLLFARLLQYRAYKEIARTFADRMATAGRITPRQAGLEPEFASLLPELVIAVTPEQFAMIAARALTPKAPPTVGLEHLHAPQVSVREQATILVDRLRARRQLSFRALVADADSTLIIVARFLALLELFKEAAIAFEQAEALGELGVRWTGSDAGDVDITDEFDEQDTPGTAEAEAEAEAEATQTGAMEAGDGERREASTDAGATPAQEAQDD
jgi:segregation and condensation protein A